MRDRGPKTEANNDVESPGSALAAGRQTRTERLPVQRKAGSSPATLPPSRSAVAHEDPFGMHLLGGDAVHEAADRGFAGAATALPHGAAIQQSFGAAHDVGAIEAHVGGPATDACGALGAEAYARGDSVAFAGPPDLHTAAHEAAHVVQQQAGVQLAGGVGIAGDPYELQADAVADRVVAGQSAEALLPAPGVASAASVQRKARLTGMDWRNAVIDGVNRVQQIIREAQADKKGRLELDLLIEPDFVGVHGHNASGKAPKGDAPDGTAVSKAAEAAFAMLVDEAPAARKVYTVVLERTQTGWDRPQFTHTGETRTLDDAPVRAASSAGWDMANQLDLAHDAGRSNVRFQVAMSDAGVQVVSWQATGSGKKSDKRASTKPATESFENLASTMQGRVLIYEITHESDGNEWTIQSWNMLGEVKPVVPKAEGEEDDGAYQDEGEMAIEDVQAARRLVLTTAAKLIAEQDPTRLDNLIYSVGPFAALGVLKVGKLSKLAKLGKLGKVFGRPAGRVFGETNFRGLVRNRKLRDLTDNEITNAFAHSPFKLSSHANKRLREVRTTEMGYETLDDVAGLLNNGIVQATKKADDAGEVIEIAGQSMKAVVNIETNVIMTFKPF